MDDRPVARGASTPPVRVAARVLLLDPDGRLLMFRGFDPADPEALFWFTVGGGVDPGESVRDAAVRELREETGVELPADRLVGPVWRRDAMYSFDGTRYRADEWFFVVRLEHRPPVDVGGFDEMEVSTIDAHRWWSAGELDAAPDTVYPPGLSGLLRELPAWDGRVRPIS